MFAFEIDLKMSSIARFLRPPPPAMMIWLLRKAVAKNKAPNRSGKVKPLDPPPPQPQLLRDSMKRSKLRQFYCGQNSQKKSSKIEKIKLAKIV